MMNGIFYLVMALLAVGSFFGIRDLIRTVNEPDTIELSKYEKMWIKLCKLHYKEKYPYPKEGGILEYMKPLFKDIYGWDPDEHMNDYKRCLFNKLFSILVKIDDRVFDPAYKLLPITEVFKAAFDKSIVRPQEEPIERAIAEVYGLIQCNTVIRKDGTPRYSLEIEEE